ncbi:hypothetical protein HMPREF9120_01443 [Neisseria sp. oral taxon 020 str. F0370]|nr:hypothetical protein HMPREF9120_01443 [Neisseria sp. oral taxon 020 str. F0370]
MPVNIIVFREGLRKREGRLKRKTGFQTACCVVKMPEAVPAFAGMMFLKVQL